MSPKARRKSLDSSDSDSGNDSNDSHNKYKPKKEKKNKKDKKDKKDKEYKKHKDDDSHGSHFTSAGHAQMPLMPQMPSHEQYQAPPPPPAPAMSAHNSGSAPPASGYRIPLTASATLPPPDQMGPAPCVDLDGRTPVYIGSALLDKSVQPCKIGPHLRPACSYAYGGSEIGHHGRYDLLPFDPNTMEFVPTSDGKIPPGRRPIEGGYEEDGSKLYHAVAMVQNVRVPGKTGTHLGGCNHLEKPQSGIRGNTTVYSSIQV